MKNEFKPLTTKDVALGNGSRFTEAELKEYLARTAGGKGKPLEKVKEDLIQRITKAGQK
jgi:predicted transcriptional regulator